jgi:hypothetical protein
MLRQIHGRSHLHVPQVEDAWPPWDHYGVRSFHVSYACEQASCELASAQAAKRELVELRKGTNSQAEMDAPKASSSTFKPVKDTKDVPIDDADPAKPVRIGTTLSDKRESALIEFL